jgi:diketogulonate reductase-like aldo/keto reductase
MKIPVLKLNNGKSIPQIGLGLWQVKEQEEFNTAFKSAIKDGYRHFDTAQAYNNEQFLGAVWQSTGLVRDELFITTKIAVQNFGRHKPINKLSESLNLLSMEYIDLLLLHFPVSLLRKKSWQALEEIKSSGKAKAIGVSNYTIRHLEEMKSYANEMPAVNQVELHIFLQQPELIDYCRENNIVVEAYSPLAHAKSMENQTIIKIAEKHNKSYAQIMLRWLIEHDLVVLPKSISPERIKQNIDIFDFKLDQSDLNLIAKQNQNLRTCWDPTHIP